MTDNEHGFARYISGVALEQQGAQTTREGIIARARGYAEMLDSIRRCAPDGKLPKGPALAAALRKLAEESGLNPPIIGGFDVGDDRERSALDWFHNNPKQVAILDKYNEATRVTDGWSVQTLQTNWRRFCADCASDLMEVHGTTLPRSIEESATEALAMPAGEFRNLYERSAARVTQNATAQGRRAEKRAKAEPAAVVASMSPWELTQALAGRDDVEACLRRWRGMIEAYGTLADAVEVAEGNFLAKLDRILSGSAPESAEVPS